MAEAILLLRLEHHHADDLLKLIEQQLDRGAPFDLELLQSIVDYFADYPDQCHHPVEDLVFRKLHARDPDRAASVAEILKDHKHIAQLTKDFEKMLARADDENIQRTQLAEVMRKFVDHYREHMGAEERDFFPLALKTLSENDWAELEFSLFDRRDPLFDRETEERFRKLREKIEKLAKRSYARATFLRKTKEIRELTGIGEFNERMRNSGEDYRIVEHPEGGYGLEHSGRIVLDIPKCSPARAAWCAYFYVEGAKRRIA